MNTGGFGFSFGQDDEDDEERRKREEEQRNNGFGNFGIFGIPIFGMPGAAGSNPPNFSGLGPLGEIFDQFGQMMSGMASPDNSQDPLNFELVERTALQHLRGERPAGDQDAVRESIRLAEIWLDDATILPATGGATESWNAETWLKQTLPVWKRLISPVAEHTAQAQLDAMPEEAREMMGPMAGMFNRMNAMSAAVRSGHALAELAQEVLTGSDFGLPLSPAGVTAILPRNLKAMSKALEIAPQELLVYICAREVARQRLFHHVPWLRESVVSAVEEYAAGMQLDTSALDEAMRDIDLQSGDPQRIQEAMERMQSEDVAPRLVSRNEQASSRLETLLALIEGWVDHVVDKALGDRIPSTPALSEAWRRRRATGGSADKALSAIVGIDIAAPKVSDAAELWRRVDVAVGPQRRDAVWDHPDFLPVAADLENSASFIDGLLGEDDLPDFDPIAEINKLEEMLHKQEEEDMKKEEDSED